MFDMGTANLPGWQIRVSWVWVQIHVWIPVHPWVVLSRPAIAYIGQWIGSFELAAVEKMCCITVYNSLHSQFIDISPKFIC